MTNTYAGIGSRNVPVDIFQSMSTIAEFLAKNNYILRSGGAFGSDTAFEVGCDKEHGKKEIFLPWSKFNGNLSSYTAPTKEALQLASSIHPNFNRLSPAIKLLIGRNMHQILGPRLDDPVELVICWTPDGCESHVTYTEKTGGTGSAIALASKHFIPVYNLYNPDRITQVRNDVIDRLYCYAI